MYMQTHMPLHTCVQAHMTTPLWDALDYMFSMLSAPLHH